MKTTTPILSLLVGFVSLATAGFANAAIVMYDEGASGDLSDLGPTPTSLGTLSPGVSTVTGSMGGSPIDRDIFTFNIAAGQELTSIEILGFNVVSGTAGGGSFFTAGTGATSGAPSAAGSFGFEITGNPGVLFDSELEAGPGDYSMWIQETAGGVIEYTIGINVIPEPSAVALLGLTLVGLLGRRRR